MIWGGPDVVIEKLIRKPSPTRSMEKLPSTNQSLVPKRLGPTRLKDWSGLSFPPSGDLANPGIEPESLMSPALAGRLFITRTTWEVHYKTCLKFQRAVQWISVYCFPRFSSYQDFSIFISSMHICFPFFAVVVKSIFKRILNNMSFLSSIF